MCRDPHKGRYSSVAAYVTDSKIGRTAAGRNLYLYIASQDFQISIAFAFNNLLIPTGNMPRFVCYREPERRRFTGQ